jgi:hypothetical protein
VVVTTIFEKELYPFLSDFEESLNCGDFFSMFDIKPEIDLLHGVAFSVLFRKLFD